MSKKTKGNSKKSRFERVIEQYWWVIPVVILGSAMLFAAVVFRQKKPAEANTRPIAICADEKATDFDCWKDRYEALVIRQSTQTAFADFKTSYDQIPYVKTNCHQIAHIIGRTAGHKYQDVSKAYAEGDNFCWSGYYHGVMEAIAGDLGVDKVLSNLNGICETLKTNHEYSFDHFNCVHGLGHGLMAVQNNNLFVSLDTCNKLDGGWQQQSCYGGVFMENVMNEINPGHTSEYLKSDDPLYPCTAVEDQYKQQCYLMQTSHALIVVGRDFSKIFDLCSSVQSPYSLTCYQSLGRDASGGTVSDLEQTKAICLLGKSYDAQDNCFIGAVKDFISFYHSDTQGVALCNSLADEGLKQSCLVTAKDYYATF